MKRLLLPLLAALVLPTSINALPIADIGVRLTNNEAYDEKVFITNGEIKADLKVRVTHICYMSGTDNIQLTNNPRKKPQRKTPTHTHQRIMYKRNQLKLRK